MTDKMTDKPKYVVLGGGTGSFPVLNGLKTHSVDLTALVGMADDGGSTGTLRGELGVLPPGDVRQCLVALSSAPEHLRDLFSYRFQDGAMAGHSFGNIFLSAAEKATGSFGEAVRVSGELLRIKGRVLPVTFDDVHLRMELSDHTILKGQRKIDDSKFCDETPHPKLYLEPKGKIAPEADEALRSADIIIIAPGDIYTSLGPLLIVDGVARALAATNATVIYVCNLVVKDGHTTGKTVADHAAEIERLAGGKQLIDYVLYNTASAPPVLLERYKQAGELMVTADAPQLARAHYRSVGRSLISSDIPEFQAGDMLAASGRRSFIRHNAKAVANAILEIAKAAK